MLFRSTPCVFLCQVPRENIARSHWIRFTDEGTPGSLPAGLLFFAENGGRASYWHAGNRTRLPLARNPDSRASHSSYWLERRTPALTAAKNLENGRAPRCCPGCLLVPSEAGLLTPSRAMDTWKMAAPGGFAPPTSRFKVGCSDWLRYGALGLGRICGESRTECLKTGNRSPESDRNRTCDCMLSGHVL